LGRVPRVIRPLVIASAVALVVVASAYADWGGSDPARNTPLRTLPYACHTAPAAKSCIDAGVYYLDKARARAGLPPYALPADFPSLKPEQQLFILTNLDRVAYGLQPIAGLTAKLNHVALVSGVWRADDPHLSNATDVSVWWPGWAGSFDNAPMAYEVLVWDDGLGSTNPRCTPTDHSRCWGHRHSVLWKYGAHAAMGAAAGRDLSRHQRGYAYLYVGGSSGYHPTYSYTWKQAVADGAGTNAYDPGSARAWGCKVPAVIGLRRAPASRAIEKKHCAVGDVVRVHTVYAPGIVFKQHPSPGRAFETGTKVTMTVSLGPKN
jgi:hypothetical protein